MADAVSLRRGERSLQPQPFAPHRLTQNTAWVPLLANGAAAHEPLDFGCAGQFVRLPSAIKTELRAPLGYEQQCACQPGQIGWSYSPKTARRRAGLRHFLTLQRLTSSALARDAGHPSANPLFSFLSGRSNTLSLGAVKRVVQVTHGRARRCHSYARSLTSLQMGGLATIEQES